MESQARNQFKGKDFTSSKYCSCKSIKPFHLQLFLFVKENTPENGEEIRFFK